MYLKKLEMVGFKSFAERTVLEFTTGMTAIVGPNGCGKSNVSDAVRWVLGEQSPKAMRGGNMQDVIFNGTDLQKPMGMAEVSLTLTDCEETLGTEYNEVTLTRRVLRSGEGQYFINRTPCRLKDIQRLFMDTGIGTDTYSILEQGRIDKILSSRPEDRRAVFEEASGITKYKADKKEALRKLQHTEANLLRLEDIIREIKRQIISLQRQAGKARRYQSMHAQLRGFDIYVTRNRLAEMDKQIDHVTRRVEDLTKQDKDSHTAIEKLEQDATDVRNLLREIENNINRIMDESVRSKTELDRTHQNLTTNKERIKELNDLSARNTSEAETARQRLEQHQQSIADMGSKLEAATAEMKEAEALHSQKDTEFQKFDKHLLDQKEALRSYHNESVDLEAKTAQLQNERADIEAREHGTVVKRERLMVEQKETARAIELHGQRLTKKETERDTLQKASDEQKELRQQLIHAQSDRDQQIKSLRDACNGLQQEIAAKQANIDLLNRSEADDAPYPAGTQFLMDPPDDLDIDRTSILGSIADNIEAEPDYRKALEAVMRSWLDALLVTNRQACIQLLDVLDKEQMGSARLLIKELPPVSTTAEHSVGEPLIHHVTCQDDAKGIMAHLLNNVRVVPTLSDVANDTNRDITWVTRSGAILHATGGAEFWLPTSSSSNPLTRKHLLAEWQQEIENLENQLKQKNEFLDKLHQDETNHERELSSSQEELSEALRKLAICDGEIGQIQREGKQVGDRRDTIDFELQELEQMDSSGGNRRDEIISTIENHRNKQADLRAAIESGTNEVHLLETKRSELHAELTEYRIAVSEKKHVVNQYHNQQEPMLAQIQSLEQIISERSQGIDSYQQHIEDLQKKITESESRIAPLESDVQAHDKQLEQARINQRDTNAKQITFEEELRQKRLTQEEVREQRSQLELELSEHRIRRQNLLERINSDYQLREEELQKESEPDWGKEGPQPRETIEVTIAELRTKLNSMGPVNLIAIEEHKELEERFQFLTQQQEDLINAKQQLLDMIKKINQTTTEMFSETFEIVNGHFQKMFKQLFDGGSAKLVLINEEDILESGIEIIARPPGKKLQNISLLSGGERTMTAVALLFSLYQVKPSPFCVLDELDAALDDSNIGRFVKMLQGFVDRSQFIIITHSRQTIAAADILYGITMEKHGISKVVTVKLSDYESAETPKQNETTEEEVPFAGKE